MAAPIVDHNQNVQVVPRSARHGATEEVEQAANNLNYEFPIVGSEDEGSELVKNLVAGNESKRMTQQVEETAPKNVISYAAVCSGAAERKQNQAFQTKSEVPYKHEPNVAEMERASRPEEMLYGGGSWKPIEINNIKAAKRALKNSRGAR